MLKKLKALKSLFSKPAEICRSLKARLFRREVKQSLMFKLDQQVLHRIFNMLDPVDQACLAFTCSKYLYLLWKVEDIWLWGPDTEKHAICPTAVESSNYTTREGSAVDWRTSSGCSVRCVVAYILKGHADHKNMRESWSMRGSRDSRDSGSMKKSGRRGEKNSKRDRKHMTYIGRHRSILMCTIRVCGCACELVDLLPNLRQTPGYGQELLE